MLVAAELADRDDVSKDFIAADSTALDELVAGRIADATAFNMLAAVVLTDATSLDELVAAGTDNPSKDFTGILTLEVAAAALVMLVNEYLKVSLSEPLATTTPL
ncbi:uncharacterized protein RCC_07307 [Ramularia collo-cygni]|uniref:Uncharacterized protein n=1 Tax=Ramularia collo-cygni TaxID=112498 RepID=A0A2D3VF19_9PEZI|nr:uncharacterized protein RCC_07307 [Ramularia collo-cygni]CZT21444.1 uncharacterized protein RCC_07307 [Ramularia collo-cygni]